MIKEAIQFVLNLKTKEIVTDSKDREYILSDGYSPVTEPTAKSVGVKTLTGLIDFINKGVDPDENKKRFVHILDYNAAVLMSEIFGPRRQRETLIVASTDPINKMSGIWHDTEDFIIKLNSHFEHTEDYQYIANLVSSLTETSSSEMKDDGISQSVAVKSGISLLTEEKVKNPVTLQPFRTFPEIDQPKIEYVFRIRKGREGSPPECALFEADGGKWKLDTIHKIRDFLKDQLEDSHINIIA